MTERERKIMEQTVSLESIFRTEASVFGRQQTVERSFHEVVEGRRSEELARLLADRKAKLSWIIEKAQENLSSMLNSGSKEFDDYMQSLFKQTGSFGDSLEVCGFKVPTLKWKKAGVKRTKQIFGSNVLGKTSELVGSLDNYHVNVRILALYEEKTPGEPTMETFSIEQPIGEHGGSHTCQILALTCMVSNSYSETTPEQIRKARLVHLEQTTRGGTIEVDYSKAEPVSLDQGFIDTLLELVVPETTLRLLFKKFDLPKSKQI
jgi:hypothetical protein